MKLLNEKIKKALPPLYSTEDIPTDQKEIVVKFFNPVGVGTWEVYEGSENVEGDCLFPCEDFVKLVSDAGVASR